MRVVELIDNPGVVQHIRERLERGAREPAKR